MAELSDQILTPINNSSTFLQQHQHFMKARHSEAVNCEGWEPAVKKYRPKKVNTEQLFCLSQLDESLLKVSFLPGLELSNVCFTRHNV